MVDENIRDGEIYHDDTVLDQPAGEQHSAFLTAEQLVEGGDAGKAQPGPANTAGVLNSEASVGPEGSNGLGGKADGQSNAQGDGQESSRKQRWPLLMAAPFAY